jgi:hypothetical protein
MKLKLFRNEEGQTLVFTAFLGCCLMGFMALSIDVGVLFRAQRKVQTAADAAAIAAGLAYWSNGNGTTPSSCGGSTGTIPCNAATSAAQDNGISDLTQVAVHVPPSYGQHTGTSYVEVIVRQPNPTIFMGTFSGLFPGGSTTSLSPMTVGARAVAGIVPDQNCMITLNPNGADSFDVQGSAHISAPNCGIQINSSNGTALCTTGGATVTAPSIQIVGAQNINPPCNGTQANAQTGVTPVDDPFKGITWPNCTSGYTVPGGVINSTTSAALLASATTQTVGSGGTATSASVVCVANTVSIASGTVLGATTDTPPKIFVFMNGLNQPGGTGSFTINGTVDIQGGSFDQGNYGMTINGPLPGNGTYATLGFIVPGGLTPNNTIACGSSYHGPSGPCVQLQFGSGYGGLDGIVYAPNATVYMQDAGSSGPNVYTAIISNNIYDKSATLIITNSYNFQHPDSPLNDVALVE